MTKNKILRILLITFVLFVGILGITRESKAFVVVPPGPVIGTTSYLQTGTVNQVYQIQHIQVSGGISPYTWDVVSGVLPPGLSLGVSTGMISGTPNTVDTFNFTVQVIDGNFETALQNFTLAIAPVSETGFLYTRNPPGSVIVSPVATRIQGVFGVDFCTDPRDNSYKIVYRKYDAGGPIDSTAIFFHTQGDIIDDLIQKDLDPAPYPYVAIWCNASAAVINDSFTAVPPVPTINTDPYLPTGTVNQIYSGQILQASGGVSPYSWSVISGNIPSGLLLSSMGTISGTPNAVGAFSFTVQVTDANSVSSTKNFSLAIAPVSETGFLYTRNPPGSVIVSPVATRIQGVFGVDFCTNPRDNSYKVVYRKFDSGGPIDASAIIQHAQGDVVDDMIQKDLDPAPYPYVAIWCNASAMIINDGFNVVSSIPIINTDSYLPTGTVSQMYPDLNLQAAGGIAPYSWTVVSGNLPTGMNLGSYTGVISGTPIDLGTFNFSVQVTDTNLASSMKNFVIAVAPQSVSGFVYTRTPTENVIISPVTTRIQGVFGIDFCTNPRDNSYKIVYRKFDSGGPIDATEIAYHAQGEVVDDTIQKDLDPAPYPYVAIWCNFSAMVINDGFTVPAIIITTTSLGDGFLGAQYSQLVQEIGGTTPLIWSVTSGLLPAGLVFDSSTGEISGIPTTIETANFTVQVKDVNNNVATKDLSIMVHGNTLVGSPVVGPLSGVTITFVGGVTQEGQTTVTTSGTGQPPPTGFKLGTPPVYYSISTTATFTAPVEVCINWIEGQFNSENNLKLWHSDGVVWTNVTTSLDTASNIICGLTNSFSDFAIFEKKQVVATIDIKPGTFPNTINLGSNGTVPVAIISTSEFDATTVDPLSVSLASAPVKLKGNGTAMYSFQDMNSDGLLDMIVHVSTEALQLSEADTLANLIGHTSDATEVIGSDTVRVVP